MLVHNIVVVFYVASATVHMWFISATEISEVGKLPGGVLPYRSLMGMRRWMESHFHNCSDYNGVALSIALLEWVRKFFNFGGK